MKPPICPWRGLLSDTVGGTQAKKFSVRSKDIWKSHLGIVVVARFDFSLTVLSVLRREAAFCRKTLACANKTSPVRPKGAVRRGTALGDDRNFIISRQTLARPKAAGMTLTAS